MSGKIILLIMKTILLIVKIILRIMKTILLIAKKTFTSDGFEVQTIHSQPV